MADTIESYLETVFESVQSLLLAYQMDWDRLEELRDCGDDLSDEDRAELLQLETDRLYCDNVDDALERIQSYPLSIEFRSGWRSDVGEIDRTAIEEFRMAITIGGPNAWIVGEIDSDGNPTRCRLIGNWWGATVEHLDAVPETLAEFCAAFGVYVDVD